MLFHSQPWEALGPAGRIAVLAAMAAVLIGAGVAVRCWSAGLTLVAGSLVGLRIRTTADVDPLPAAH